MLTRIIQSFLFDPGEITPLPKGKKAPLTPEQRAWRKKARERARRRQKALFAFALRKRRKKRKRKSLVPPLRIPSDPMADNQDSLASAIYSLPASIVDDICLLNLRNDKHLRLAFLLAEQFVEVEQQHNANDPEAASLNYSIDEIKRTILRIASQTKKLDRSLSEIKAGWSALAAEVQAGWTANHERKANNYYVPPLEFKPLGCDPYSTSPFGSELNFRDVIE